MPEPSTIRIQVRCPADVGRDAAIAFDLPPWMADEDAWVIATVVLNAWQRHHQPGMLPLVCALPDRGDVAVPL